MIITIILNNHVLIYSIFGKTLWQFPKTFYFELTFSEKIKDSKSRSEKNVI